jgi:hypothetical protein
MEGYYCSKKLKAKLASFLTSDAFDFSQEFIF